MVKDKAPIIRVIEEAYEIPQLKRKRRIVALLPYDYEDSDKSYPVLYLNDGQNLFNEHAPFGNWAIDQALARLADNGFNDLIVITIDHGEQERVQEYLPFWHYKWGKGKGKQYLNFIIETLKPYVDKKFRVLTDAQHTGIGGSSMGGLISLYAGLMRNDVFGKLMIFSPSLWISPRIFYHASKFRPKTQTDFYLYAGGKESRTHIPNVLKLKSSMFAKRLHHGHIRFQLSLNPEGSHNEASWRDEFPKAIEWLYNQKSRL